MRIEGRYVKLRPPPRLRNRAFHDIIECQADRIKRLQHRGARKTAAIKEWLAHWDSEDDWDEDEVERLLANLRKAINV